MVIMVGEIKVEVPEGLPMNELRNKIIGLIKEEESILKKKEPLSKEQKKKILDKYYGCIKLDRIVSLEEIIDLGEDSWRY
ncbi:MAG TPA: hypothetical protein PLQ01_10885 [Methanothrix sp.]|jgi:hypothetical protein|nr:hypothetical protein [Methanothrix sp.]